MTHIIYGPFMNKGRGPYRGPGRGDEIGGMDSWKGIGLVVFPFVFKKIRLNIVRNCL